MNGTAGARLRALRGARRLETAAAAVGITPEALDAYEHDRRLPRDEIKLRLARYYGCGIRDIFYTQNVTIREFSTEAYLHMSQRCPCCGGEPAFLYRRGEEIVGCEDCVSMLDFYEIPERR